MRIGEYKVYWKQHGWSSGVVVVQERASFLGIKYWKKVYQGGYFRVGFFMDVFCRYSISSELLEFEGKKAIAAYLKHGENIESPPYPEKIGREDIYK